MSPTSPNATAPNWEGGDWIGELMLDSSEEARVRPIIEARFAALLSRVEAGEREKGQAGRWRVVTGKAVKRVQ